jgi:hypothetical protein
MNMLNDLKWAKSTKVAVSICLFVLVAVVGLQHTAKAATGTCMSTTMSTVSSPDKKWKYTLVEGYCSGEYTFDTEDVYRVYVTSLSDPTKTEWVYQDDADPGSEYIPVMTWAGQHTLKISAMKRKYYEVNKPTFSDVPIDITYR